MEKLIELFDQIRELAGVGSDALKEALSKQGGGEGKPLAGEGGPPQERGGPPPEPEAHLAEKVVRHLRKNLPRKSKNFYYGDRMNNAIPIIKSRS